MTGAAPNPFHGIGRGRKGAVMSLRVYLDGAGKEDDHPLITVGGFYAEASVCEEIERDWEAATGGKLFSLKNLWDSKMSVGVGTMDEGPEN
jgi:hypothetical protein